MALKDLAALYGRVALVMLAFAFVAGIVAGPLLPSAGIRASVAVAEDPIQDHWAAPELIRTRTPLQQQEHPKPL